MCERIGCRYCIPKEIGWFLFGLFWEGLGEFLFEEVCEEGVVVIAYADDLICLCWCLMSGGNVLGFGGSGLRWCC